MTEALRIPTEAEETPETSYLGIMFKNKAFHCRPKHLFPAADLAEAEAEWVEAMEGYLANFCEPVKNIANQIHCVSCNSQLTGAQGMLDWRSRAALRVDEESPALEARCTQCGYPTRCQHSIFLPNGKLVVQLNWFPLQYHPRSLSGKPRLT